MLNRRNFLIAGLAVLAVAVWAYAFDYYREYKADIILGLADVAEAIALPYRMLELSALPPDEELLIPTRDIALSDIEDTYGSPRGEDREHEGIDIFAERGTPVYSATSGYVLSLGTDKLGGNYISIIGAGGRRYYYAHLDRVSSGMNVGERVTTDTVLGYVGNTGNASTTPYHLHFGAYEGKPFNPYNLFRERNGRQ